MAISGDTAIVGDRVYERTPAGWVFQQTLNGFGAVALDGDTAVIGTNIYVRTGTHWDLQATLPLSFWSGYGSLAISGDTIALGFGPDVSVFQRTNSTWTLSSQLAPADPTNVVDFGASIAVDGQTIVAGAPEFDGYYGAFPALAGAYVFSSRNGTWFQQAKLTNSDSSTFQFANAVAVNGGTLAVGANDLVAPVRIFNRRSGKWKPNQSLSLGQSYLPVHFHNQNPLALRSNALAVLDFNGTAHIFRSHRSTWTEIQTLDSGSSNRLGPALGLAADAIITTSSSNQCAFIFESQPWTWQQQDVGDTGAAGSFASDTNALIISGAGANIGGGADAFHYAYRPYSNDLEMIVRVKSVGGGDSYSRGGIMIRGSLDPSAPYAFISERQGQQIFFEYRHASNVDGVIQHGPYVGAPYWFKLRKLGDNLMASFSEDGNVWYDFGSTNIPLPDQFYVGLAVTSERTGDLATDVFDHLEINPIVQPQAASGLTATSTGIDSIQLSWADNSDNESGFVIKRSLYGYYYPVVTLPANTTNFNDTGLSHDTTYSYIVQAIEPHGFGPDSTAADATTLKLPVPWADHDIGQTQIQGNASFSNNGFTVTSGATNGAVAGLHFVYRQVTGDFDLSAWVQNNGWYDNGGTKAGLMIRSTLDASSPYVFVSLTAGQGDQFITSLSNQVPTTSTAPGGGLGELRIVRKGDAFSVFHFDRSLFNAALSKMTEKFLDLPATVYIGFAVAGADYAQPISGNFWNIHLATGADVHSIVQPALTATPLSSGQVRLSWTDNNFNPLYSQVGYTASEYGMVDFFLLNPDWLSFSDGTSFVDTAIFPGMTRNYRVMVELPDGDWVWSNFAQATARYPAYNLPSSWQLAKVGSGSPSTAVVDQTNRNFTVWGAGQSLGGTADNVSGIFRTLRGDGTVTVQLVRAVDTTGSIDPAGKYGIMIRQSLAADAPAAAIFFTRLPSWGAGFMSRTSAGSAANMTNRYDYYWTTWLKLARNGNSITGYISIDGIQWIPVGSASIALTDPALFGIFGESENGPLAGATFENLQIAPPQAPAMALGGLTSGDSQRIKIEGSPGWTNRIEISSDLVHWNEWTNYFDVSGSMEISDPAAATNSSRFYRDRVQY